MEENKEPVLNNKDIESATLLVAKLILEGLHPEWELYSDLEIFNKEYIIFHYKDEAPKFKYVDSSRYKLGIFRVEYIKDLLEGYGIYVDKIEINKPVYSNINKIAYKEKLLPFVYKYEPRCLMYSDDLVKHKIIDYHQNTYTGLSSGISKDIQKALNSIEKEDCPHEIVGELENISAYADECEELANAYENSQNYLTEYGNKLDFILEELSSIRRDINIVLKDDQDGYEGFLEDINCRIEGLLEDNSIYYEQKIKEESE